MSSKEYQKDFFELVKAIGESKSKQEEDRIVDDEVTFLKKKFSESGLPKKKLKELLVRSLYVEMLGHAAPFAYIKAVELCASTHIVQKRVGYLTASVFLSPEHEFRLMLINQMQRDMRSANHLETCAALHAISALVTRDMIAALVGEVLKLLGHEMGVVRKHAVCVLHRFYLMDPKSVSGVNEKVRRALCDKEPSVMSASLVLLLSLAKDNPAAYKDLVPSLASILKQITDHKLHNDFDYHRIPAPWIQMNLLRLMTVLGRADKTASEGMYEVLNECMRRADTGINIGYALVYEAVRTVTNIYPNTVLLDAAAAAVSRFMRSDSHNLKYMGIKGLTAIVEDHPKYALDHQMAVIDCLEDDDETLQRKTMDLLFRMTSARNIEFVVDRVLRNLSTTVDEHFKGDLVSRLIQCAERFAPSSVWFVRTMVKVLKIAGDKVSGSSLQMFLQLVAEGVSEEEAPADDADESGEDEGQTDGGEKLRSSVVEELLSILSNQQSLTPLPSQAIIWVLGEYGYLAKGGPRTVLSSFSAWIDRGVDKTVKPHLATALLKLAVMTSFDPDMIATVRRLLRLLLVDSRDLDLRERVEEAEVILQFWMSQPETTSIYEFLPIDASCEDIDPDSVLPFLQGVVDTALLSGASPYHPPSFLTAENVDDYGSAKSVQSSLKVEPYKPPPTPAEIASSLAQLQPLGSLSIPAVPTGTPPTPLLSSSSGHSMASLQGNQLLAAPAAKTVVWGRDTQLNVAAASSASSNRSRESQPAAPSLATTATSTLPVTSSNSNVHNQHLESIVTKRMPTEREKMAAALFGGMSATSGKLSTKKKVASKQIGKGDLATSPSDSNQSKLLDVPVNDKPGDLLLDFNDSYQNTDNRESKTASFFAIPSDPKMLDIKEIALVDRHGLISTELPITPTEPHQTMLSSISDAFATMSITQSHQALSLVSESVTSSRAEQHSASSNPLLQIELLPLPIATSEFGARWSQYRPSSSEVKKTLLFAGKSLTDLLQALPKELYVVEAIGSTQEAILATIFKSSQPPADVELLLHIRLTALLSGSSSCDFTVRSENRTLSGVVLTFLDSHLRDSSRAY